MTTKRTIKLLAAILLIIGTIIIGIELGIARAHAPGAVGVGLKTVRETSVLNGGVSRASVKTAAELKEKEAVAFHDKARDYEEA